MSPTVVLCRPNYNNLTNHIVLMIVLVGHIWKADSNWALNVFKILLIRLKGETHCSAEHSGKLNTAKPHPRQDLADMRNRNYLTHKSQKSRTNFALMTSLFIQRKDENLLYFTAKWKNMFCQIRGQNILLSGARFKKEWQNIPRTSSRWTMTKVAISSHLKVHSKESGEVPFRILRSY